MNKLLACFFGFAVLFGGIFAAPGEDKREQTASAKRQARGISERTPWTTSRITGTPEPPHPYRIVRVYPKVHFRNPLLITRAPGMNRFFVAEHTGKMYSFPMDEKCEKADLFLDPNGQIHSWDPKSKIKSIDTVYGLAFHPQFQNNRYCYI